MASQDVSTSSRRRKTLFLAVAVLLLLSVAVTYLMGDAAMRSSRAVTRQQAVIDDLRETLSTVKDAETGQRGFLLTGEDRYLDPYRSALIDIQDDLQSLDLLVQSDDLVAADVTHFKSLTAAKLDELKHTIDLRRTQGSDAAMAEVRTDRGKLAMDQLRQLTANMVVEETNELKQIQQEADRVSTSRSVVFATVAVVNLLFLAWAYRRIDREVYRREEAALELLAQKELLAVTLASIGDGVIVTDAQGHITFLNETAEELCGWKSAEAIGQLCDQVFNIINETSRGKVESPVDKVLRLGRIVGLANHTLLIRKNGSELPIDDSGAPVRDRDGNIRGVVLVFRDFSEHKKAETELIQAKESAEEANIAKDNFLATLSHELRTPLTPVLATLAVWEASSILPETFLADVQMLRRNVDLEARLIDDLLDLTRIVRGKLSLNAEVVDAHELIRAVTGMYQSEIHVKKLRISMNLNAKQHHVYADPARLQQVFWNILKNATKFTNQGGHIDLSTENDCDGHVRMVFKDDGIGINSDLLAKLFLPFEQGTDETVRRYGGLGLGLAICKALMDAQGGSISADSKGPGTGSTFTVSLASVNEPDRREMPTSTTTMPEQPLKILLVEDHADTARVMSRLLRTAGHQVHVADTVASAITSATANDVEMIISDIGLPDGTGIDLIQQIRKSSKIPAIALTGFGMEEDVVKCIDAGFNDHLTKPVNLQKLEMVIRQLASRKG
jgi:PAS domain S-box-containing protein